MFLRVRLFGGVTKFTSTLNIPSPFLYSYVDISLKFRDRQSRLRGKLGTVRKIKLINMLTGHLYTQIINSVMLE